ncbi:unnamed protein product [Dibothriocephalus latus]|uniref:N-acetyltransferase domain-containing protein n=1 Tax=Dibothriocephalus latus TaxID=60516 RepID=A0A3P6Q3U1_DIBLA|nr:unnamed protein product [Dibothriocephalus latus]
MFSIRVGGPSDSDELYQRTLELLEYHGVPGDQTQMSPSTFLQLQKEDFLQILVLTCIDPSHEASPKLVGYASFMSEFDMLFGGHGLLLDHFFIQEAYRGKGQGRRLLKAVCEAAQFQQAKYLKLYFKDGLRLDKFYEHFGFSNLTKSPPYMHYFEIYGHKEIQRCLRIKMKKVVSNACRKSRIEKGADLGTGNLAWQFELPSRLQEDEDSSAGPCYLLSFKLPHPIEKASHSPPDGVLIILLRAPGGDSRISTLQDVLDAVNLPIHSGPEVLWSRVAKSKLYLLNGVRCCAFVEKPAFCGWLGKMVTFCDFVGDLSILCEEVFVDRVKHWALRWSELMGVNFEVPVPDPQNHDHYAGQSYRPLLKILRNLRVSDSSQRDGWNAALLEEEDLQAILMGPGDRSQQ